MAKQPRDRQQQQQGPGKQSAYAKLIAEVEKEADGYRGWALPAFQEAHEAGQVEMAAWLAAGAAGKTTVLQEFSNSKYFTRLVYELEKCFGPIQDNSDWPNTTWPAWAHLVVGEMVKFEAGWSGEPPPAPALTM